MRVKNPAPFFKMWCNVLAKDEEVTRDQRYIAYHSASLGVFDEQPHATLDDEAFCQEVGLNLGEVEAAIDALVDFGYMIRDGYKTRSGGIKLKFVIPSDRVKRSGKTEAA